MPGVGTGNNPNSRNLTDEHRQKAWARARKRVNVVERTVAAESVPSKYRLLWAQEEMVKVAKRVKTIMNYWGKIMDRARKDVLQQKGWIYKVEIDGKAEGKTEEEIRIALAPLKLRMLELKATFDEAKEEYREAEKWFMDIMNRMGKFAEAAAPYFDPKLAAIEKHVVTESTKVSVNVAADAADLLSSCGDALRELASGRLGPPPRPVQEDGARESVDRPEAIPKTADVPDGTGP